jgi:hypothetical protein
MNRKTITLAAFFCAGLLPLASGVSQAAMGEKKAPLTCQQHWKEEFSRCASLIAGSFQCEAETNLRFDTCVKSGTWEKLDTCWSCGGANQ